MLSRVELMPFTEESIDLSHALILLRETPVAIVRLLTPLPDALLDATDGPDTWSPRVILQHLTWAEVDDWIPRVRLILEQQDRVPFTPFDRDGGRRYDGWPIERLGDEFLRLRAENLAILDGLRLGPAELQLPGSHPALGGVTMSQLIASWVAHDLAHLDQISRTLARQYAQQVGPWRQFMRALRE